MVDTAYKQGIHDEVQQFLRENKIRLGGESLSSSDQEEKNKKVTTLNQILKAVSSLSVTIFRGKMLILIQ